MSAALVSLLIAVGDDELIIGHRHSEWTGFAPHIEEDVAFSSIAQDEIGHAAAFYSIVASITGDDPDRLALGREPPQYRNALICERPNGDWAYTLARHWIYDTAEDVRLASFEGSRSPELGALARKLRREERYHLIHADAWIRRIAGGPLEGRAKLNDALAGAFSDAAGLFEPFELEAAALEEGWAVAPSEEVARRFFARAGEALDELGLPTEVRERLPRSAEFVASSSGDLILESEDGAQHRPEPGGGLGGRRGRHSSDFEALWDEMTKTYRTNPGASW